MHREKWQQARNFRPRNRRVVNKNSYESRLPTWFHRANWGGGALACLVIGLYPLLAWEYSLPVALWALFWVVMAAGAANNARLGLNSIHIPARFRKRRRR